VQPPLAAESQACATGAPTIFVGIREQTAGNGGCCIRQHFGRGQEGDDRDVEMIAADSHEPWRSAEGTPLTQTGEVAEDVLVPSSSAEHSVRSSPVRHAGPPEIRIGPQSGAIGPCIGKLTFRALSNAVHVTLTA